MFDSSVFSRTVESDVNRVDKPFVNANAFVTVWKNIAIRRFKVSLKIRKHCSVLKQNLTFLLFAYILYILTLYIVVVTVYATEDEHLGQGCESFLDQLFVVNKDYQKCAARAETKQAKIIASLQLFFKQLLSAWPASWLFSQFSVSCWWFVSVRCTCLAHPARQTERNPGIQTSSIMN